MGQSPVSHSSAARATPHLSGVVVVYRREATLIGDLRLRWEEKFSYNSTAVRVTLSLHFFLMIFFFFFKCQVFSDTFSPSRDSHISYMKNFNEISYMSVKTAPYVHLMKHHDPLTDSNQIRHFKYHYQTHWCHIFGKSISVRIVGILLKPFKSGWRQTSTVHKMVKYTESAESFGGLNDHFTTGSINEVHVQEKQTINSVFFLSQYSWRKRKRKKDTWGLSTTAPG